MAAIAVAFFSFSGRVRRVIAFNLGMNRDGFIFASCISVVAISRGMSLS